MRTSASAVGNLAVLDDYRRQPLHLADGVRYDEDEDALEIEQGDGGVIIQFGAPRGNNDPNAPAEDFYENLAELLDPGTLASMAYDLLEGIQADEQSRTQWIADRTRGMDLLAIKVETPRTSLEGGGLEGMSSVRHPLLLEACIRHQSNSKRELLPADGPVKVKNLQGSTVEGDTRAEKFQQLMNRLFTDLAPEYYPDTDRMFFDQGFSGMGFKKGYHCPIRRRPVSDTVQGKDLIVSNDATDIRSATRVTHQLTMTKATVKRMQYVGAWRNVNFMQPQQKQDNRLTQKQGNVQGIELSTRRPEDQQYTIYECYTTRDLAGFEHEDEDGEATGLPLPYKITLDKDSRQILEVRRNWNEDAEDNFEPRRVFTAYPYVPMFGFYATGLLHILGNTTTAVTAAWRILLDSGMFANFPGFLYAKNGGRQDDLSFRVPPGGGAAVDLNGAEDIRKTIMPMPYKDPGASTVGLVDNIIATGQRVGGTADLISQDKISANQPVGTTMALVEQAAITVSAVHERMYVSQAQEFAVFLDLCREDPDAIWRLIEKDGTWTKEELFETLEMYNLVPVADPNTPTHIHRIMQMTTVKQLQQASPQLYNAKAVDTRILRAIKINDPESLFAPPAPPGATPPDPAVVIAEATKQTKMAQLQSDQQIAMVEAQRAEAAEQRTHELKIAELELKKIIAGRADATKVEIANLQAETADKDRRSQETLKHLEIARDVALDPHDDDNHAKALELKKAGPPKTPKAST